MVKQNMKKLFFFSSLFSILLIFPQKCEPPDVKLKMRRKNENFVTNTNDRKASRQNGNEAWKRDRVSTREKKEKFECNGKLKSR